MANDIRHITLPGYTDLWAIIYKDDSGTLKANINGGDTWEVWSDPNIDNYAIPMTNKGHGVYTCDFPPTILTAGQAKNAYLVVVYQGPKTAACYPVGYYYIEWDGSQVLAAAVALSLTGLDAVRKTEPTGDPSTWTFQDWLNWLTRRFGNKATLTLPSGGEGTLVVRNDADDGDLSSQDVDETGTNQLILGEVE